MNNEWFYNFNIPLKKIILFESKPDYSDNTYAVYQEMLKEKLNKDFKFVWIVNDKSKYKDIKIKNVKFINKNSKGFDRLKISYYRHFAQFIIDSNDYIKKLNKNQFRIFLTHGAFIKVPMIYGKDCGEADVIASLSNYFSKINKECYCQKNDNSLAIGFPRNDALFEKCDKKIFEEIPYNKLIVWLPTYRNHKAFSSDDNKHYMNIVFNFGIPVIENENELLDLNQKLVEKKEILIVKLHPAEDDSKIKKMCLSNIKLIDDDWLKKNDITLYQLLEKSDALITDYSSVYYDYLLTEKMIGIAAPDINEYRKNVELLFDDMESNIPGEYIYTYIDLLNFFDNVSTGNDLKYEERKEKINLYHRYNDGNSAKRVIELVKKISNGGKK